MNPGVPDFEQRLASLQTQLDPLQHAGAGASSGTEQRLAELTEECAEIVRRWALTSERHARAVTRFEGHLAEWNDAGNRLQQDAAHRIEGLEKLIQQEWSDLKHLHEDPVRQLSEHATSLTQVCIATANAAQQGFERSEARLAAIEGELNRRLGELTREVHTMVSELRAAQETSLARRPAADTQAWPLDGVTRLHHQLREADGTAAQAPPMEATRSAPAVAAPPIAGLLPEAATALTERIESLERAVSERESTVAATNARSSRSGRLAIAGLAGVVAVAATVVFLVRDVRDATARAERAEQAQAAASIEAARQVDAARQEFTRAAAEADARATRAQTMTEVLAASDLVRYNLFGRRALTGLTALVTWSPTRGIVFSGSQLPAPPAGSIYQLWLLTRAGAVTGGTFSPEPNGTATLAAPRPQSIGAPVTGAMVTIESVGGRTAPIGEIVLARPIVVAAAPLETPAP